MASHEEERNITIGAAVLALLTAVMATVYIGSAKQKSQGYELTARFNKAEGIAVGSEVRISGVVVGKVSSQVLDEHFRAVLGLNLSSAVKLPTDSNAAIQTDGLLGAKFIALQPGGDEKDLQPGQEIPYTQDSLALQDILDMIIAKAESAHGETAQH